MTDQELLNAYVYARDVDSLGAFVTRHQDGLLRYAARMLSDELTAQDVVQETFLRVARHPRRLLGVDSCQNWLMRVARNICLDHIRKAVRGRKAVKELARRTEATAAPPEEALVEDETRTLVFSAIDSLRPRWREIVLLKVQEGKSYREIAEITGLTVTNVGYILHHAMKALSKKLARRGGES